MKIKYLLIAAVALSAAPAMAQDFAGPRVEARTGWTKIGYDAEVDGEQDSTSAESVTFGGEIGFDVPLGSLVAGGYVGADFGSAEFCEEVFGEDEACADSRRNLTVGVRAGVPLGSALIFAKGGYSNSRLRVSYDDFEDTVDELSESDSLDGFHIGAGFEIAAGPNVYVKAEYVYTMYNGADGSIDDIDTSFDADRQQALIGVGFRF